ncbi:PREDICTED: NACHT, LRR and PYD domains-containing protein 12-like [Priapulus caudatus]|uniref:NACHT, LRR and PYD domains-containing protein 12-like n=1 Tax=Priapulus caudatus TaxID=37621 RepID=A0ABM1E4V0_PRICU|nr:PREDICTED: NACHT, LRR and PYD domains-containing protein 12-like [Priapulus caudatus]
MNTTTTVRRPCAAMTCLDAATVGVYGFAATVGGLAGSFLGVLVAWMLGRMATYAPYVTALSSMGAIAAVVCLCLVRRRIPRRCCIKVFGPIPDEDEDSKHSDVNIPLVGIISGDADVIAYAKRLAAYHKSGSMLYRNDVGLKGVRSITLDETYTQLVIEDAWKTRSRMGSVCMEVPSCPQLCNAVSKAKKPIRVEQLLSDMEEKIYRPTVLVLGNAGIGKSVMAERLVCDWANEIDACGDAAFSGRFKLAFLFRGKQLNRLSGRKLSLLDLLLDVHTSAGAARDAVAAFLQRSAPYVLIVVDGFDELASDDGNSAFARGGTGTTDVAAAVGVRELLGSLVAGRLLSGAHVLVTSRPSAAIPVADAFHRVVEILGFSSDGVREYVARYFGDGGDGGYAERVFAHLRSNLNVFSLCSVPVCCRLICQVYDDARRRQQQQRRGGGGAAPLDVPDLRTVTGVYSKVFCQLATRRHCHENNADDDVGTVIATELDSILNMADMALAGVLARQLMFSEDDLRAYGLAEKRHLLSCFMTCVRESDGGALEQCWQTFYLFDHLTVQEYLASLALLLRGGATADDAPVYYADGRLEVVYRFFAGLPFMRPPLPLPPLVERSEACMRRVKTMIARLVSYHAAGGSGNRRQQQELAKTLMQMALEVHESETAAAVMPIFEGGTLDLTGCIVSAPDLFAMGYLLSTVNLAAPVSVTLDNCNIDDIGAGEVALCMDKMEGLSLVNCHLSDEGLNRIFVAFSKNKSLRKLCIGKNEVSSANFVILANALGRNKNLTSISMESCVLEVGEHATTIAQAWSRNTSLTYLNMRACDLQDLDLEWLSQVLASPVCALQSVKLDRNMLKNLRPLFGGLESNSVLQHLSMRTCMLDDDGLQALSRVFNLLRRIENVSLAWNSFSVSGMKPFADALSINQTLKHLDLSACELSDEALCLLAGCLQNNTTLKTLMLFRNTEMTTVALEYLASMLRVNKTLETLLVDAYSGKSSYDITVLTNSMEQDLTTLVLRYAKPRENGLGLHLTDLDNIASSFQVRNVLKCLSVQETDGKLVPLQEPQEVDILAKLDDRKLYFIIFTFKL